MHAHTHTHAPAQVDQMFKFWHQSVLPRLDGVTDAATYAPMRCAERSVVPTLGTLGRTVARCRYAQRCDELAPPMGTMLTEVLTPPPPTRRGWRWPLLFCALA